jgi:hypothetical protein
VRTETAGQAVDERRAQLQAWLSNVLGLRPDHSQLQQFLASDVMMPPGSSDGLDGKTKPATLRPVHSNSSVGSSQAEELMSPTGVYRCVRRTVIRESWVRRGCCPSQSERAFHAGPWRGPGCSLQLPVYGCG